MGCYYSRRASARDYTVSVLSKLCSNIDTRNPITIMPLVASFGSWVCSHIPCTTILRACTTPFQVVCLLWPIKADLWYLFWGRGQNYRKSKVLLIKTCSDLFLKDRILDLGKNDVVIIQFCIINLWSFLKLQFCFGPNQRFIREG